MFMNLEINNSKQCRLKLLIKILSAKKHVIFVQNFTKPSLKAEPNLRKLNCNNLIPSKAVFKKIGKNFNLKSADTYKHI